VTTKGQAYLTPVACRFQGKQGLIVLDQLRCVDRVRLVNRMGKLTLAQGEAVLAVLAVMFVP
jgi:mRNA interferase MazF